MSAASAAAKRPALVEEPKQKRRILPAVPFHVIDASAVDAAFEEASRKRGKESPYRNALIGLISTPTKALCFEDVKARGPVYLHARKLKLKILFAEVGGKLYVKLDQDSGATAIVRDMIREMPLTKREIVAQLTARGLLDVKVDEELRTLSDSGFIVLGSDSRWKFTKK
jgi:hypothetical protein